MSNPEWDNLDDFYETVKSLKRRAEIYIEAMVYVGILANREELSELSGEELEERMTYLSEILDSSNIERATFFLGIIANRDREIQIQ